jgi:hypothetical protein
MHKKKYTLSNFLSYLEYVSVVIQHWHVFAEETDAIVMPSYMLQKHHAEIVEYYVVNSDDQGFHLPQEVLQCNSFQELKVIYDDILRDLKSHDLSMFFDYDTQSGVNLRTADSYLRMLK